MLKFALPAVAALGLIAYAAQSSATDALVEDAVMTPQAMGWHASTEGAVAKLAYGVANSDQLVVMLSCTPGSGAVEVYGDVVPVGRTVKAEQGRQAIDPLGGGLAGVVTMKAGDATLKTLATRGTLKVEGDAGRFDLAASQMERRMIQGFMSYCTGKRA